MERLVDAEGNAETNIEEVIVEKGSSSLSLTKRIADPVVYKLVRVEGDGRLVPATDDELMEVENLLEDDKGELPFVEEHRYPKECISSDGFSSEKAGLESSEDMPGLSQTENMEVDARTMSARLEYIGEMLQKVKQEEKLRLSSESPDSSSNCMNVDRASPDKHNQSPIRHDKPHGENSLLETDSLQLPKLNDTDTTQVASAEMCPEIRRSVFGESSASNTPTTRKPDFSTIKGDICLDNLSIRELHETFRATFGRETSVKDKLWLKRRIAMGLTNSCDVSTTSFIIKDKTLIRKKEKEAVSGLENSNTADGSLSRDEIVGATSDDHRDQITRLTEKSEDRQVLSGKRLRTAARVLVDALVENNALELLVQNLGRLSETDSDESAAIYNTLATIENMIEVKPAVAELVCERTKLLRWLLSKIKVREFDGNKQYASEILAILLQNSTANQKRLGQMNGVDIVLQAVAMYKSRDPKSSDEEEMVENLFDCLCCLLMPVENKEKFVKAEGVELMIIIMKQKKLAYGSAIRALDFAMTKYPSACERFVDVLGLKTAFAAFMGKIPVSKKNKKERFQEELEERIISLIASLFGGILRGSRRERLLSKFVENEYEKIDRLMELYMRYSDRVKAETERLDQLELDDLEMDDEERYNRKLESGLYTLQLIAVILGHLWSFDYRRMRERIELLLRQQKLTRENIKEILQEYHDNIGDLDGPEEKERAQAKIKRFIASF